MIDGESARTKLWCLVFLLFLLSIGMIQKGEVNEERAEGYFVEVFSFIDLSRVWEFELWD